MTDAFAVLGLDPAMNLCPVELETRYLELSREFHPDFASGESADTQAERIRRSADVNDAYRALRNPWVRAERVAEVLDPGCMERTKALPPMFLMEAMELAEEVAGRSDDARPALHAKIEADVNDYLARITQALEESRGADAAVLLHESRYFRKALHDLDDPEDF